MLCLCRFVITFKVPSRESQYHLVFVDATTLAVAAVVFGYDCYHLVTLADSRVRVG